MDRLQIGRMLCSIAQNAPESRIPTLNQTTMHVESRTINPLGNRPAWLRTMERNGSNRQATRLNNSKRRCMGM
jgi:hypothetical protein